MLGGLSVSACASCLCALGSPRLLARLRLLRTRGGPSAWGVSRSVWMGGGSECLVSSLLLPICAAVIAEVGAGDEQAAAKEVHEAEEEEELWGGVARSNQAFASPCSCGASVSICTFVPEKQVN